LDTDVEVEGAPYLRWPDAIIEETSPAERKQGDKKHQLCHSEGNLTDAWEDLGKSL
jgi:hypothetical protein